MSKFTSIEELFNTAEQSVGPPTEGGNGNQELRVFQPDRGIDLTYNNPNFINSSSLEFPNSTKVTQENDNRQTLGTVTLNNRDYWENSNFDESIFQSYVKGKIETALNTRPIIDGNEEEIVFNESFDVSSTYRYSIDALPFVTDVNNDDEIIRLDRYYDKEINPTEYNLATEGKINYYLYPRTSGRTPSHNIETYGSKQKFTGGGKNRFDFYISQSISVDREDTGFYLFRLDWGDGTPREHTSELKLLEGTTLLEHFYEKPGFYSITGLVCAIYEGRIIGGYEKFQTNILLNPSENYELKLYDFSNFATIGGLSSDSSLVKSTANIMGLNPLTLNPENEDATPKLIEKLNLLDRLTIFNFLNKINSELNDNFTSLLNPYSIEISDSTEPLIDEIIFGCIDSNANNFVEGANTDDGSCDYNFNIGFQVVEQGESLQASFIRFIDIGLPLNDQDIVTNDKGQEIVIEGEFFYEADILNGENVNEINSIDLLGDSSSRPRLFVKFEIQGQPPENLIVLNGESRSGFILQQIIVIGGEEGNSGDLIQGWYSINMTIEPGPENFGDGDLLFELGETSSDDRRGNP
tara:strand:+ start:1846 stop:3585 length:1740 start_codon:yes stop_codon:yes gene_type:complete